MNGKKTEPVAVAPAELDRIEAWFDAPGGAAKVFRQSLEAGGIITEDLLKVCAAVNGILAAGLTRDALAVLIVEAGPKKKGGSAHGSPALPKQTALDVLDALANLRLHLTEPKREKLAELPEIDARWAALSTEEKARLLELAKKKGGR